MALTANRNTPMMGAGGVPVMTSYPVATATHIYEGSIVGLNAAGYAEPANTSTTVTCLGVALQEVNNAGGNGAANVPVMQGVAHVGNHSSLTLSSVGDLVYVYDDSSVQSSGSIVAGTVYLVDSTGIWVYMGLNGPLDAAALTTFTGELASTSNGEGASLVGVEDAGSYFAGADVEAVLQDLGAHPKMVISCPIPAYSEIADAGVLMRITPGFAGRISKIVVQATTAVSTSGKSSTLTAKIAGTSVTGGAVTITTAGQNAIGAAQSASASAANTFTAAQEITVVASSTTAFVEGAGVIYLVLA